MNRSSRLRSLWPVTVSLAAGSALVSLPAAAQEASGQLTGRVTEQGTGVPLAGVTVVVQGAQGEDGTVTDAQGVYMFPDLPVGTYTVHFYSASGGTQVETPPLQVSAQATARANGVMPSQTQAAAVAEQTYVIQRKASSIDVGSSRLGTTWDAKTIENLPVATTTFDAMIEKAPGAFVDPSGSVSIAGATGLENSYVLDGVNVTGLEYGELGSRLSNIFVKELQINTGGYAAEYGGAMGGTINVVTKSGTNTPHASAQLTWAPYWLSRNYRLAGRPTDNIVGQPKPDYDTEIAAEAGAPIIKDKLFAWVGISARFEKDHLFRIVRAGDVDADGNQVVDGAGNPVFHEVQRDRMNFPKRFLQFGGRLDFVPQPGQRLTLSLVGAPSEQRDLRYLGGGQSPLFADPRWPQGQFSRDSYDVSLRYNGNFLDKHLEIDGLVGSHWEHYSSRSAFPDLNNTNQIWHQDGDLYGLTGNPGCAPITTSSGTYNPCGGTLPYYYTGGYGEIKEWTGHRTQLGLKGTLRGLLGPVHVEAKAGTGMDFVGFNQDRRYSGPSEEERRILVDNSAQPGTWSLFTLPPDRYPFQFAADPSPLAGPPYYRPNLKANVGAFNTASFAQVSGTLTQKVTLNLGGRLETQSLKDSHDQEFLSLLNLAPRVGLVVDPEGDGRTKLSAHYGQFYEMIPMNLAARYFGGEGILQTAFDPASCAKPSNQWDGKGGDLTGCTPVGGGYLNNGKNYPVQPDIKGQYSHEIALGFQREVIEDLVLGVDYTRRWLGRIIEDGTAAGDFTFVLANPGDISDGAISTAEKQYMDKMAQAATATDPDQRAALENEAMDLNAKVGQLKALKTAPKPERTYNALTFRADKRFSRYFSLRASYTYSRLIGTYNGLFDADNNYFAPNGNNTYDLPDLWPNRRGPLANDRPHSGRLDGYTTIPVSPAGTVVLGLGFFARSGAPRSYQAAAYPGLNDAFIIPRGAAGRTPAIWQLDAKIAYRHKVKDFQFEAFADILNLFNQQAALQMDDIYTYDLTAPIVNGTKDDLKYAKNGFGQPITKNPNFGNALSYQAPWHMRIGLRMVY